MFHQASSHPCRCFSLVSKDGTLQQSGAAKPCVLLTKTGAGRPQTFKKAKVVLPSLLLLRHWEMLPWQAEVLGQYCCLGFQVPTAKPRTRGRGVCGLAVVVWRTVMERLEGVEGAERSMNFIGICWTGGLFGDVNLSAWANDFPDEGNNSQGRHFDCILPSHSGADEMSVLARHSGWTCLGGRTFWQLAVGLGHFFLWEQEFKQAGAPGGWQEIYLAAGWLIVFLFPPTPSAWPAFLITPLLSALLTCS